MRAVGVLDEYPLLSVDEGVVAGHDPIPLRCHRQLRPTDQQATSLVDETQQLLQILLLCLVVAGGDQQAVSGIILGLDGENVHATMGRSAVVADLTIGAVVDVQGIQHAFGVEAGEQIPGRLHVSEPEAVESPRGTSAKGSPSVVTPA